MELREIITIFRRHKKIGIFCVVGTFLAGGIFFLFQPDHYRTELVINVTRGGMQQTDQYRYDDFYRLQADERFADTIVRWLGSSGVVRQIRLGAQDARLVGNIKASRLSSQMIVISYTTDSPESAKGIADATVTTIRDRIDQLNSYQQERSWFTIVADEPFIETAKFSFGKVALAALLLGMFAGFWGVLLAYYFEKGTKKE